MIDTVSIVVPTRNAGPEFCQLLQRVRSQKGSREPEIVVIDSESTDQTPEIARQYGARVVGISAASFNHGETRNLGIREARGEICILLVQDALPTSDDWLQSLVNPFDQDSAICGVTTGQIPRPECDIVTLWEIRHHNSYLGRMFAIRSIPDWAVFSQLSIQERFFTCNFDNVCSAIRRSAWEEYPFRPLPFAEDLDWGVRVLRAGKKIAYEPAAMVVHSHLRPAIYHLRRQYISAKTVPEILDTPVPAVFSSHDPEFFAAAGSLIEEVFALVVLVDRFAGSIESPLWREWVKSADRRYIMGSPNDKTSGSTYMERLRDWINPNRNSTTSSSIENIAPAAICDNPMRAHFYFLLSEVPRDVPSLDAAALRHLVVHCLARTLGHFLGSHFLQSERHGGASAELRALDRSLCVGV